MRGFGRLLQGWSGLAGAGLGSRRGFACLRRQDVDGAGGGAGGVRGDVVDSVGGRLGRVDDDVGDERAVEEGLDAEVEVLLRAGDGGAEVVVGTADTDVRGVRAVDRDDGRSSAWCGVGVRRRICKLIVGWGGRRICKGGGGGVG